MKDKITLPDGTTIELVKDEQGRSLVPMRTLIQDVGLHWPTHFDAMKNHWLLGEPFGSMTRTVAKDGSQREMVAVGPATALVYLANVDTEHHNRKPESVKKQKAACSILLALCNADREAASKYDPRQTEINALIVQELENSYAVAETKKAYEDKKAMGTKIRQKREALQKEVAEGSIIRMDFSKQID